PRRSQKPPLRRIESPAASRLVSRAGGDGEQFRARKFHGRTRRGGGNRSARVPPRASRQSAVARRAGDGGGAVRLEKSREAKVAGARRRTGMRHGERF